MNSVLLSGSLISSPPSSGDCSFPSGMFNVSFSTRPSPLSAPVNCSHSKNVNSSGAFTPLDGVGPAESVTKATFLYFNTQSPMRVRLTVVDTGGDVLSVVWVQGPMVLQFPSTNYVKLVEVQGAGYVEYFAAGNE